MSNSFVNLYNLMLLTAYQAHVNIEFYNKLNFMSVVEKNHFLFTSQIGSSSEIDVPCH